jgi:hypothetical protein
MQREAARRGWTGEHCRDCAKTVVKH